LDLKKINYSTLKSYFSIDFLSNPFISIDYLSYLLSYS